VKAPEARVTVNAAARGGGLRRTSARAGARSTRRWKASRIETAAPLTRSPQSRSWCSGAYLPRSRGKGRRGGETLRSRGDANPRGAATTTCRVGSGDGPPRRRARQGTSEAVHHALEAADNAAIRGAPLRHLPPRRGRRSGGAMPEERATRRGPARAGSKLRPREEGCGGERTEAGGAPSSASLSLAARRAEIERFDSGARD